METRSGQTAPDFRRIQLGHVAPAWVKTGSLFFVTICCERRGENQLCRPETAAALLSAAQFYHDRERWFISLFLLMPDHLHALLAFPSHENLTETVRNWKSYTSRKHAVVWQRSFVDHRLRNVEQWQLKADYIRQNPVRQGLIADAAQWPFLIATR